MNNLLKKFSLFMFLLFLFLYKDLFVIIPLSLLKINIESLSYNLQLLLSLISSLILLLIIVLIYHKYLKEKFKDFKKHFKEYLDFGFKYWIFGIIGMASCNILINIFTPMSQANNEQMVQEMLFKSPIISFISASFIAPFLEEMLFRKSLCDAFNNKKLKVIVSGFVFGLLHVIFSMESPLDLLYIFPYGFLGSAFAYMISEKDNVFISTSFHVIHNSILTLVSIALSLLLKVLS